MPFPACPGGHPISFSACTGRKITPFATGSRVSMGECNTVSEEKVIEYGLDAVVPSGGITARVVTLSMVAFPVSKSVVSHSAGTPLIILLLKSDTIGELPVLSAGTGIKSVRLYSGASVAMVQE